MATLLPGAEFATRSPYPDARRLLDAGATVALATDCNPGSSYTTSMPLCIALAVREMRMTPAEAVWAATAGGAAALRRTDIGHLGVGARADLVVLDAPSHVYLAYRPGVPLVKAWCGTGSWHGNGDGARRAGIAPADVLAVARGGARVELGAGRGRPRWSAAGPSSTTSSAPDGRSTACPPGSARWRRRRSSRRGGPSCSTR